jgi:hypothetical protein
MSKITIELFVSNETEYQDYIKDMPDDTLAVITKGDERISIETHSDNTVSLYTHERESGDDFVCVYETFGDWIIDDSEDFESFVNEVLKLML